MDGFEDVQVTSAYPIGDDIGVEYEVTCSLPLTVNELNYFLLDSVGDPGLLGRTDLLLKQTIAGMYTHNKNKF